MKNKLTLQPGDYIVFHPGLKIENVSTDSQITMNANQTYEVEPVQHVQILSVKKHFNDDRKP